MILIQSIISGFFTFDMKFYARLLAKIHALMMKIFSAVFLLFVSSAVYATVESTPQTLKADPMSGDYLVQLVLGLMVVILFIFVFAWFAKKMNRFQSGTSDSLKIIGGISMGSRERVVLLQVGEQQILLGVSPGRINALHLLDQPIESASTHATGRATGHVTGQMAKGFSDKLKSMMHEANNSSAKQRNK